MIAGRLLRILPKMMLHLGIQNALGQRVLQLIEQTISFKCRLGIPAFEQRVQSLAMDRTLGTSPPGTSRSMNVTIAFAPIANIAPQTSAPKIDTAVYPPANHAR